MINIAAICLISMKSTTFAKQFQLHPFFTRRSGEPKTIRCQYVVILRDYWTTERLLTNYAQLVVDAHA